VGRVHGGGNVVGSRWRLHLYHWKSRVEGWAEPQIPG